MSTMSEDHFARKKLRQFLKEKYSAPEEETVWEAAVRYGKFAYESYSRSLNINLSTDVSFDELWELLSTEEQFAWIEVGDNIEWLSIQENT